MEHGPVHLTRGDVAVLGQVDVDETLVMAQVEVCFRTIVGNEHFTMLIGAHRTRVNIDVRVELLNRNLEPAALQETAQRCRRDAFAQGRYHTTGNEDILCHDLPPYS